MTATSMVLVMLAMALVTVLGDWLLKLASQQESAIGNHWFVGGTLVYACCAFGWVYAMQHMKLATLGVVYSLATVVMLTALGVFVFGETLNRQEMLGLVFAGMSVLLLVGYSS
jgi:drug/metabolite transporter (DMT)-like permease